MKRQGFFFQRRWFAAVYITVAIIILLLVSLSFAGSVPEPWKI